MSYTINICRLEMPKGYNQRSRINLNKEIKHTHHLEVYQMDSASAESVSDTNTEEGSSAEPLSRYEAQKRRDWTTFLQYLKNHKPPLSLARCSGAHVIEFMKYLDQFGKTKVHVSMCTYFGCLVPPASCTCPLKQAWGSLDALVGRLRAAYEENGGQPDTNPFGGKAVRIYLKEVRDDQAKARGISYEKKRKRLTVATTSTIVIASTTRMQGTDQGGAGGYLYGKASTDSA